MIWCYGLKMLRFYLTPQIQSDKGILYYHGESYGLVWIESDKGILYYHGESHRVCRLIQPLEDFQGPNLYSVHFLL